MCVEGCRVLGPTLDPLSQTFRGVAQGSHFKPMLPGILLKFRKSLTSAMRGNLPNSSTCGVEAGARRSDHFKVSKVTDVLSFPLVPYKLALLEDMWRYLPLFSDVNKWEHFSISA